MAVLLALIQVGLIAVAALWLWFGRPAGRVDLILRIIAAWLLMTGVATAGLWLAVPISTVPLLGTALLISSAAAVVRFSSRPARSQSWKDWPSRIFAVAFAGLGLWAGVPAIAGWRTPPQAHDLRFPFNEGRYIVANGGSSERINGHFMTLAPRFRQWRGESYAVDLIRVDRFGFRTIEKRPFSTPRDPREYLTFGTPVQSPCTGVVEAVDNSRPDMPVPDRDRQQLEGNFVRLRCAGMVVLLGHFRHGGVQVRSGQMVTAGEQLGFIGNSGNTDEPHFHIHAQTPGTPEYPLSGDPVPITFEGRFPVRNMIFAIP